MADYALYKGDNLLIVGSLQELAEFKQVKVETIYFYATPAYKKRVKRNGLSVIKLED